MRNQSRDRQVIRDVARVPGIDEDLVVVLLGDVAQEREIASAELSFEARAMQLSAAMRMKRFLAITAFTAMLGLTTTASAQHPRVATLHEGVQNLETRSKTVRHRAERASETARQSTRYALGVVDRLRVSITTRLELLELLGKSDDADARDTRALMEMEKTLDAAKGLLAEVESWFGIR